MDYRKVGKWGLIVSELSVGSWLTFGKQMGLKEVREVIHTAFDSGITFFDTAEAYNGGVAEYLMGQALRDFNRMDYVVSTKIFWWGPRERNQMGLSRKHLIEGLTASLKRLQMDYVDIVYCHRPDPETPMEEIVSGIKHILDRGMAIYWGTSEWDAELIQEATRMAREAGIMPPIVEQPQYNLLVRDRVEREYLPLYEEPGIGLTTFSPLASGILTGKYLEGIPEGSRLDMFPSLREFLEEEGLLADDVMEKVRKFGKIAEEMGVSMSQLAIAWILKNPRVSSVILGVSSPEQLKENLRASEVKDMLTQEVMEKIEEIF